MADPIHTQLNLYSIARMTLTLGMFVLQKQLTQPLLSFASVLERYLVISLDFRRDRITYLRYHISITLYFQAL